jgi:hypothetical protein
LRAGLENFLFFCLLNFGFLSTMWLSICHEYYVEFTSSRIIPASNLRPAIQSQ